MTPLDPKTREQLCAWMDGEVPPDEARFLERRLASDAELRAQWERWQLASACIKGELPLPMRSDLSERVMAAISAPENAAGTARHRPVWGWAIAASIAALAVMVGVQMRPEKMATHPNTVTHASEPYVAPITASPASADLVALNSATTQPTPASAAAVAPELVTPDATGKAAAGIRPSVSDRATEVASLESPIPLNAQSPTDFPLLKTSEAKSWPRSPLSSSGNDVSMEAYLVRHNEMVSDGGLGGFVPYVDVVTRERDHASDNGSDDTQAIEDGQQ
jgi:negative regulator of sigma E activity